MGSVESICPIWNNTTTTHHAFFWEALLSHQACRRHIVTSETI